MVSVSPVQPLSHLMCMACNHPMAFKCRFDSLRKSHVTVLATDLARDAQGPLGKIYWQVLSPGLGKPASGCHAFMIQAQWHKRAWRYQNCSWSWTRLNSACQWMLQPTCLQNPSESSLRPCTLLRWMLVSINLHKDFCKHVDWSMLRQLESSLSQDSYSFDASWHFCAAGPVY